MPPKRSTRAKVNGDVDIKPALEMNGSAPPTSMLHALAHIPPAPPGPALPHAQEEDDDLTPPPELSPVKTATPKQNGASRKGKANVKGKTKVVATTDQVVDSAELAEKRKDIQHQAAEEMATEIQGKRRKARVSYTENAADEEEAEEEIEDRPAKEGRSTPKKVKDEYEPEEQLEEVEDEPAPVTPKKGGKKKAVKTEDGEEGEEKTPKEKKPRKPTPKKSRLAIMNDEPDYDEDGNEIVKKKRKPKVYAKIEYVIPDVPKKTTNFKGKLSSACTEARLTP